MMAVFSYVSWMPGGKKYAPLRTKVDNETTLSIDNNRSTNQIEIDPLPMPYLKIKKKNASKMVENKKPTSRRKFVEKKQLKKKEIEKR